MDLDAYVAAHRRDWDRLETLVGRARRPRRLSGAEVDELVTLYQRVATHLSVVRSASPDPALVARLSTLLARARSVVTGSSTPALRDLARFLTVSFPAACWRTRWWWAGTAALCCLLSLVVGIWVAGDPYVQGSLAPPDEVRQLVEQDFEDYYSSNPAGAFATQVWINNAWVAAIAISFGILVGVPTALVLVVNAVNVGVVGGFMAAHDRSGLFFGLILPHGLLELTAVFLAGAAGLRLGWTVVDPGPRRRADALASEGRSTFTIAMGLVLVLAVAGAVEAFVTPSGLPTSARIGIGALVEAGFLAWVLVLGRRAARAGETGDLTLAERGDALPVAG